MNLDGPILKTISYFDLFDYPLSRAEVWKYLVSEKCPLAAADAALAALITAGKLEEKNGLIFFPGRESIVAERASRYRYACRKWRRARRFAAIFFAIPGVLLVGIGNTLSYNNAKDGSDIDFFIVVRRSCLWRTRLAAAGLAALCRLRPTPADNRDKLCLSFFVAEDEMGLKKLALTGTPDVYLAYWIAQMVPLRNNPGVYEKFLSENDWARTILPNAPARHGGGDVRGRWKYLFAPLALLPGGFLKSAQTRHFPAPLRAAAEKADGGVVINDGILKFHLNDRRAAINDKWLKKCAAVLTD